LFALPLTLDRNAKAAKALAFRFEDGAAAK
jgi:hypothetical protein